MRDYVVFHGAERRRVSASSVFEAKRKAFPDVSAGSCSAFEADVAESMHADMQSTTLDELEAAADVLERLV